MARPYAVLRGLMAANDYSQPQLARKLEISTGCLSRKMNGRAPFTLEEGYATLFLFNEPIERLHEVFPPNGIRTENRGGIS
jgi:hypothetical protein